MGDPDLHSDEKVLLTTQDVFVKSIPFEAVLTNKRIILLDRKKNLIPQKDILIATIGDIAAAENAIRDQTITLSLITSSGETRQLVLTFSRTAGGGRKRERDEWFKTLKELTSSSIQKTIRKVVPPIEPEARKFDTVPRKKVVEQAPPRLEITRQAGVRKEIEAARPIKTSLEPEPIAKKPGGPEPAVRKTIEPEPIIRKIVEPEYLPPKVSEPEPARKIPAPDSFPPKPVETSSLPVGTFCTRCGNRVPPDSIFCNRCGSRVVPSEEQERQAREPAVPQVTVESRMPAPKVVAGERRERPIEREIQSIEPLIEGSVPRKSEAPPIPHARPVEPAAEQPRPPVSESASIAQAAQSIINAVTPAAAPATPEAAASGASPAEGGIPGAEAPQPAAAPSAAPPAPPAPPAPRSRGRRIALIVVGILVILAIASVGFLFISSLSAGGGTAHEPVATATETPAATPTPTPIKTPVPTTVATVETTAAVITTPQVLVPTTGVWIRITYPNTFSGSAGLAGSQDDVEGTGDKFYMVATSGGIVEASVQKTDGSGDELLVRIYKDGELIKSGSTTSPKGTVEIRADLRPAMNTTSAATTTTAANASATS